MTAEVTAGMLRMSNQVKFDGLYKSPTINDPADGKTLAVSKISSDGSVTMVPREDT